MTYGGTYRYYTKIQARYGVEFTFVDTANDEEVRRAFRPNTKMLHLESPTNPTLRLCDIAKLSAFAHEKGAIVVVDNTFCSPYLQRPLDLGADIVMHSTTKFLNGHSDSIGGIAVAKKPDHVEWLSFVQNSSGAILSPVRLLPRAARNQDPGRADGAARVERPRRRRLAREAEEDLQGQLSGPARSSAVRPRAETDEGIRRDDLLRPRLVREGRRVPRKAEALLARREPRRRRDPDLASGDDDPRVDPRGRAQSPGRHASSNSLLIYASNENYQLILRTLAQLDRPQLQVAIDATVAEVKLNDTLSYGVQFFLQSQKLGLKPDIGSVVNTTAAPAASVSATGVASAVLGQTFPGFNFLVGSQSQPNVIINALHSITDVKVLSNPSLVVTDNQVATLMVGDDVPISTGTANVLTTQNTIVNTIDYRSTGIILRVVPRVSANGNVRLEIEQEISQVSAGSGSNLTPTISQRKVKSSISVATGQTVLLAGLIQEQKNENHSGIPLLDQLPAIGNVVGDTGHNITRTELIIFIRPQIIRDSVDAHYVAEELRTKLKGTLAPVPPYVGPAPRAR